MPKHKHFQIHPTRMNLLKICFLLSNFVCARYIAKKEEKIIVIVPEACNFLPQRRSSPVKISVEKLVKEGPIKGNFLWIDSQEIAGIDSMFRNPIDNWIIGRLKTPREIKRTLDVLLYPKPKPEEIQALSKGFFYVFTKDGVKKCYVQPSWLNSQPEKVKEIARRGYLEENTKN